MEDIEITGKNIGDVHLNYANADVSVHYREISDTIVVVVQEASIYMIVNWMDEINYLFLMVDLAYFYL